MFSKTIIDSDAFLDMPMSTQTLYFHLSMRADDDGFINNPKKIQRMIGATDDDLKLLIAKNFIILFESGVIVIKHWRIHNYIRNDRYKPTNYQDERALLSVKENGTYTLGIPNDYQVVDKMETQVRIGKDSIGKDIYNYYQNEIGILSPTQYEKLEVLINKYGEERVKESIDIACDNNVKTFNYVSSVIKNTNYKPKKEKDSPEWMDKEIKSEKVSDEELEDLEKDFEIFS